MKNIWKNFVSEESGQGMVEYGLIIALIAVVLILVLSNMSTSLKGTFGTISDALEDANKDANNGG